MSVDTMRGYFVSAIELFHGLNMHATKSGFLASRFIFYIHVCSRSLSKCTYVSYTSRKALVRLRKCTHSSEVRLLAYAIKTNVDIVSKSIKCTE